MLTRDAIRQFIPRPRTRSLAWSQRNVQTDRGRPFDHAAYPHLGAPGGPFDSFDDPSIRTIWLQFASRLGKTFFGQCCTLYVAAMMPGPQMFATSTEKLAKEVIGRLYKMLARCPELATQVRPSRLRRQDLVVLDHCQIFVAWAQSVSTLADKAAKFGHGNEVPKWHAFLKGPEGDPLELFQERGKEFPGRKYILEGTPTVTGECRIEHGRLRSDNRALHVACPLCGEYQRLRSGRPGEPDPKYGGRVADNGGTQVRGGLVWDALAGGRSDADLAARTARYVCCHCEGELRDHHRGELLRSGVWVPAGCGVDRDKAHQAAAERRKDPDSDLAYLTGTPLRRGPDAGFQLSSLHALALSWGDYAHKLVSSVGRPKKLQNFINSWEGLTWEPFKQQATLDEVSQRLRTDNPRGTVPAGGLFLTVASDRQGEGAKAFPFVVQAWGADERAWLVDYGQAASEADLWEQVITRQYPHADGGEPLQPVIAFMDSGYETKDVYDFCETHAGVFPCKGEDAAATDPYRISPIGGAAADPRRSASQRASLLHLILVNTDFWETELAHRLEDRQPGDAGSLALCREASLDLDFLNQVCNGALAGVENRRGVTRLMWVKKDANTPNDFRDALRYGQCAARVWLDSRGGLLPERGPHTRVVQSPEKSGWIRRPKDAEGRPKQWIRRSR